MKLTEAQIAHLVLSFQEGTISSAEKELLDAYIALNPQLAEEFIEFPKLSVSLNDVYSGPNLSYQALENIEVYRTEKGHPFDKISIGSLEGLLSKEEQQHEKNLRSNPRYQAHKTSIAQTKLIADLQILFPNQNRLFKEANMHSLPLKKYLYWTSAAAAAFFTALLLIDLFYSNPTLNKSSIQHAQKRKIILTDKNVTNIKNQEFRQSSLRPSIPFSTPIDAPELEDCILQEEPPSSSLSALNSTIQSSITNVSNMIVESTEENSLPTQSKLVQFGPVHKEPITMKAFLIQKTNERLFGEAQPTQEQRFVAMARYANQSIGLPLKYTIEDGVSSEKILIQLGPISIERSRSKK